MTLMKIRNKREEQGQESRRGAVPPPEVILKTINILFRIQIKC